MWSLLRRLRARTTGVDFDYIDTHEMVINSKKSCIDSYLPSPSRRVHLPNPDRPSRSNSSTDSPPRICRVNSLLTTTAALVSTATTLHDTPRTN
ncbi:hypothetical protein KCV07_g435, partial [Aureobasidium melanogenum]